MNTHYTYLLLMLFTVLGPFLLSFERRVHFVAKWKYLLVPNLITAIYFIVWDVLFTIKGIWSFNDRYILGYKFLHLPLEEYLFFFFVPFACVFNYEVANYYLKKDIPGKYAYYINGGILLLISIVGLLNLHRTYTAFNFLSAAILCAYIQFRVKPKWLGRFYMGYFISLLPFLIVNGILTALPVVSYNNAENLGIRIFTIPVEDTIYCLLLLMMNVWMYEGRKQQDSSSAE